MELDAEDDDLIRVLARLMTERPEIFEKAERISQPTSLTASIDAALTGAVALLMSATVDLEIARDHLSHLAEIAKRGTFIVSPRRFGPQSGAPEGAGGRNPPL